MLLFSGHNEFEIGLFGSYKEPTYRGDLHAHDLKVIARKKTPDNKLACVAGAKRQGGGK